MNTLRHGPFELELAPDVGGSVRAFRADGRDVLRPGPRTDRPAGGDALAMAAFPLVPFAGRIAFGRFAFDGRQIVLAPNFPPEPHAIHGQAWQAIWQVEYVSDHQATLGHEHRPDSWPWTYRAEQRFDLDDAGLVLQLSVTNRGARPMPAGLGWHPYFPCRDACLTADLGAHWRFDRRTLVPRRGNVSSKLNRDARPVEALNLDDVFDAGTGDASISWPHGRVSLCAAAPFAYRVVYVPPGEDYFCVEPITHVPNALNATLPWNVTGMRVLDPGATLAGSIRLSVDFRGGVVRPAPPGSPHAVHGSGRSG